MTEREKELGVTREQLDKYLQDGGGCLYCGSGDLDCDTFEHEAGGVYQRITCNACGRTWTDCYHMNNVLDSEGNGLADELPAKPVEISITLKKGQCGAIKFSNNDISIRVTIKDYDVENDVEGLQHDEEGFFDTIEAKNFKD